MGKAKKSKKTQPHRRRASERQLNIDQPRELLRDLEDFCEETKMKRKAVVELALRKFLNDQKQMVA